MITGRRAARSGPWAFLAVFGVVAGALGSGCSSPPAETLVGQFFRAVQQDDGVSAGGVSMVAFPGGPVDSWELLEIGPMTEGPYRVPELRSEENAAEAARDQQFKVFSDFRQANREALEQIVDRRDGNPDVVIGGRLGELAAAWDAHAAERRQVVSSLSEVQMALEEERRRTRRSLLREAPVDYLTGNLSEQEVLIRTVEEGTARAYRFSLLRYDLQNQHGAEVPARWIIAAIEPATDDPASP